MPNPRVEVEAVIGVLAPNGIPIFEWGHETTPTDEQIRQLAEEIVAAIERGGEGPSTTDLWGDGA